MGRIVAQVISLDHGNYLSDALVLLKSSISASCMGFLDDVTAPVYFEADKLLITLY